MHFATTREALQSLKKEDEIVVYCSDENCFASRALGQLLEREGYAHVLHYAGGLADWEQAGYPFEGEWVKKKQYHSKAREACGDCCWLEAWLVNGLPGSNSGTRLSGQGHLQTQ
ncbi:MAG: rhodanese-like domain-containing protein [Ktedonobacteraceae bacterium]